MSSVSRDHNGIIEGSKRTVNGRSGRQQGREYIQQNTRGYSLVPRLHRPGIRDRNAFQSRIEGALRADVRMFAAEDGAVARSRQWTERSIWSIWDVCEGERNVLYG